MRDRPVLRSNPQAAQTDRRTGNNTSFAKADIALSAVTNAAPKAAQPSRLHR
jgi:hypothetical protein